MSSDALIQLQEELAHQALEIARMSEELYTQQKEIAQLRKQVESFKETVENASLIREQSEEEAPPHY